MQKQVETNRIEAFSDGVFAIAITLLVLEIKVPVQADAGNNGLWVAVLSTWPSFLAFVTSFVTILVVWVHHHWIFSVIAKVDHALFYWNGLLLLFVTFIPFPTGLLAAYLLHPDAKIAASLYTGTFLAISLTFRGLWWHVSAGDKLLTLEAGHWKSQAASRIASNYRLAPVLYLVSFAASFVSEILSITSCMLLALVFAIRGWPEDTQQR
jgi:uncharacterized membrane protein